MNNSNNNVDLDYEMSELAENSMRYNVLIQQMNHKLSLYRTAIQDGGRA
jgi:flagellar basal-body rod protein FlgB